MKTTCRSVALLLGVGLLPLCANAQKKVIIEDDYFFLGICAEWQQMPRKK